MKPQLAEQDSPGRLKSQCFLANIKLPEVLDMSVNSDAAALDKESQKLLHSGLAVQNNANQGL